MSAGVSLGLSLFSPAAAQQDVTLPGARVFPESISSTSDGTLYSGSIGGGGVYRALPGERKASLWIKPGAFGSGLIFGVLADERSGILWVCSNELALAKAKIPGMQRGSALIGFDLRTGKGKISARLPGDKIKCNDIAVGGDGSAYITDMADFSILVLHPGRKALEVWLTDSHLVVSGEGGPDGLAFGGDGNLYVNTWAPQSGLLRIEVIGGKAGKVTPLKTSRPIAMADGLRPIGGNAFLMAEGTGKVDLITVRGDEAQVETLKDGMADVTGVTLVGDTAYAVEGQLNYLVDPGKTGQIPPLPFHITAIPLKK